MLQPRSSCFRYLSGYLSECRELHRAAPVVDVAHRSEGTIDDRFCIAHRDDAGLGRREEVVQIGDRLRRGCQ